MQLMKASAIVAALSGAAAMSSSANAQGEDKFYAGRTITIVIGFGPGGTYDYYARLVARHIGKHIAGKPNVVAQQMPGAGSLTAANFLYAVAPKDGTSLGMLSQTLAIEEAIGNPGVKYKSAQMSWIGRATSIAQIQLSMATSKFSTIEDVKKAEATAAGTGAGSPTEGYPKLLNGTAGTRFRIVGPYPGSVDGLLALERGEVDTALTSYNTIKARRADWIAEKKINVLVTYSMKRHPELPQVPAFPELGKTDADKQLLEFYVSAEEVGRSFVAPPGLPPERVTTLRTAFTAMVGDADFLAEAAKAKAELDPLAGEELQKIIVQTVNAPRAMISRMRALLK